MRLAVLGVLVLFAAPACDKPSAKRNLGRIAAEPSAIDFGTKSPGERTTAVLKISNSGEAELRLAAAVIRSDARGAFMSSAAPASLAVGASAELTITYVAPLAEGVDGASVEIESDADNAPLLLIPLGGRSQSPCPMGRTFCNGDCADLQTDVAHCGSCTTQCPIGQVCAAGVCRPCTSNAECAAGKACVNGACGPCASNAHCNAGQACVLGACGPCANNAQCDADAGQACVNMACGPCAANAQCATGQACVAGRCGPCTSPSQCAAGQGCVAGSCAACALNPHCGPGQACVSGACGPCAMASQCDADAGQACVNGACGPCATTAQCEAGLVCSGGACVPCGSNAQCPGGQACINARCAPCTMNGQCDAGQVCVAGACGACTQDTQCAPGDACFNGACAPCTSDFCTMKGLILAWSGPLASIPSGWALADGQNGTPDLRGWFLKGAPAGMNPGGTGGSLTHDHGGVTGTTTVTTQPAGSDPCNMSVGGTSWIAPVNVHTHTYTHSHAVGASSHLPPYFELAFIVKHDSALRPPDGTIVGWSAAASPSGGWLPLDGNAAVPDLRGRFLRGAGIGQNPGGVGGSATHAHDGGTSIDSSNLANAAVGNYSFAGNAGSGCGLSGEFGHWHNYPHGHAISAANHEPPHTLVTWVTASNAAVYPTGAIAMWGGSVVSPPRGWAVCDGTNGTPDLTGRFLKGTPPGATPGTSGGSASHAHGGMTEADDGGVTTVSPNTNSPAGGATGMSVHRHGMPPHAHPLQPASTEPPFYNVVFLIKR